MGKYQVIDVYEDKHNIKVEIEHEDGTREVFGYQLGMGYGDLNMNGEIRAVALTLGKLKKREEEAERALTNNESSNLAVKRILTKNRIFSIDADTQPGKKKIKEVAMDGEVIERDKDLNITKKGGKAV